eukprot:gene15406-20784_t
MVWNNSLVDEEFTSNDTAELLAEKLGSLIVLLKELN